jgi:hypothetical protein
MTYTKSSSEILSNDLQMSKIDYQWRNIKFQRPLFMTIMKYQKKVVAFL